MASYHTERGPRQHVSAYLGELDEAGRLGIRQTAGGVCPESFRDLWAGAGAAPEWVAVDLAPVERNREFGGPWLGLQQLERLRLPERISVHSV